MQHVSKVLEADQGQNKHQGLENTHIVLTDYRPTRSSHRRKKLNLHSYRECVNFLANQPTSIVLAIVQLEKISVYFISVVYDNHVEPPRWLNMIMLYPSQYQIFTKTVILILKPRQPYHHITFLNEIMFSFCPPSTKFILFFEVLTK